MVDTVGRLEQLLQMRDEQIKQLEKEVYVVEEALVRAQRDLRNTEGGWTVPSLDDEDIPELPLPRLEVRWYQTHNDTDWGNYRVVYQFVYKHFQGHIVSIPLGVTAVHGHHSDEEKPWHKVQGKWSRLPFRESMHMHHDVLHFNLPLYAVTPDGVTFQLDLTADEDYQHVHALGREHRRAASIAAVEGWR